MTSYYETANVAHVMRLDHDGQGAVWNATCGSKVRIRPSRIYWEDDGLEWPIHHVSSRRPRQPWCRNCVRILATRTARLIMDVFVPAAAERGLPKET